MNARHPNNRNHFAPGTRWRKSIGGRTFVFELHEDQSLTEWLEDAPDDTWQGTWWRPPVDAGKLRQVQFDLTTQVGHYITMYRNEAPGSARGKEVLDVKATTPANYVDTFSGDPFNVLLTKH